MTQHRHGWCADMGLIDFASAHSLQLELVDARGAGRLDRDVVLVMEHPAVFTVGRRGNRDHLKVSSDFLRGKGVNLFHIERGGDITFHGPGQIVLYPIFQLPGAGLGVVDFVEKLEEVMLRTAMDMGVAAGRDRRNHGVWVGNRKLGFVGIAVRHRVSFHGMSLNVNLPLEPFSWIDPCGLENVDVTSLQMEAGAGVGVEAAKGAVLKSLGDVFSISLQEITISNLKNSIQSTRS